MTHTAHTAHPSTPPKKAAAVLFADNLRCRRTSGLTIEVSQFVLEAGDIAVMDAPSGTGKSTALALLSGAMPSPSPDATLAISGRPMAGKRPDPTQLGLMMQASTLNPSISVRDNITLPCRIAQVPVDHDRLAFLMEKFRVSGLEKRLPSTLSMGQKQRIAAIRALLPSPALLLLDEPVSSLDPENAAMVEQEIEALCRATATSIVLASHQADRGAFARYPRVQMKRNHADGHQQVQFSFNRSGRTLE